MYRDEWSVKMYKTLEWKWWILDESLVKMDASNPVAVFVTPAVTADFTIIVPSRTMASRNNSRVTSLTVQLQPLSDPPPPPLTAVTEHPEPAVHL